MVSPDRALPESVVIVGAGECGAAAAATLRDEGYMGTITLIGAEALPPYERPPLSKESLAAADEPLPVVAFNGERLPSLDIDFISGVAVEHIDRNAEIVRLADGREIPYDRLLLATGARARELRIEGGNHALTLRTYHDALALRTQLVPGRHIVVLGAGFIGLEVAASARRLGCRVTVLEMATSALSRAVPSELTDVILKRHIAEGVDIWFGVKATVIRADGDGFEIEIDGRSEPLTADAVVAGIGATPNVELAAEAGLRCDNGIAVDAHLQTSDPHIYAAGDCAAAISELYGGRRIRLESWRNAYDQAATAAANMLGAAQPHEAAPWFWSDQYDLGLQLAGLFDAAAAVVVRNYSEDSLVLFGLDTDGHLVAAGAVGTGTSVAKDIRIAEKMIAARGRPTIAELTDPGQALKQVLRRVTQI